jgi:hypothetical protein
LIFFSSASRIRIQGLGVKVVVLAEDIKNHHGAAQRSAPF